MRHEKYMLGMLKDPMGTLDRILQNLYFLQIFSCVFRKNMLPEVNHMWQGQDSQCQDGCHENMPKNEK